MSFELPDPQRDEDSPSTAELLDRLREEYDSLGLMSYTGDGAGGWIPDMRKPEVERLRGLLAECAAITLDASRAREYRHKSEYLMARMLVAVSFLPEEQLDEFHRHVAKIDERERARSGGEQPTAGGDRDGSAAPMGRGPARYMAGMRENDEVFGRPKTCWALLPGNRVCILERGHDEGAHEE